MTLNPRQSVLREALRRAYIRGEDSEPPPSTDEVLNVDRQLQAFRDDGQPVDQWVVFTCTSESDLTPTAYWNGLSYVSKRDNAATYANVGIAVQIVRRLYDSVPPDTTCVIKAGPAETVK